MGDSYTVRPRRYARHAYENGAEIRRNTEVTRAAWGDGCWRLHLSPGDATRRYELPLGDVAVLQAGPATGVGADEAREAEEEAEEEAEGTHAVVEARLVVACGGLRGDALESLHRAPPFAIRPRRGDFVLFDETAATKLGDCPIGQVPAW